MVGRENVEAQVEGVLNPVITEPVETVMDRRESDGGVGLAKEAEAAAKESEKESEKEFTAKAAEDAKAAEAKAIAEKETELADDEIKVNTFTEFATELEIDPESLYGLTVPMRDGVEPKSMSELKDFYHEHINQEPQNGEALLKLREENATLREQSTQALQFNQQIPQAVQAAQAEQQQIEDSYNSIDWPKFEMEDPGNAALQRQKYNQAFGMAQQKVAGVTQHLQQEQQRRMDESAQLQRARAIELIPEWANRETVAEEIPKLQSFIDSYGFSAADFEGIQDARVFHLVRDFMALKNSIDNVKISPIPDGGVVLKKGGLSIGKKSAMKEKAKIIQLGKESRNVDVKQAAIEALLR